MPNSPFAKIAELNGLDFNADKQAKKGQLSLQHQVIHIRLPPRCHPIGHFVPCVVPLTRLQATDVFEEHHQGRRWAESLALMARKTGAYRPLVSVRQRPDLSNQPHLPTPCTFRNFIDRPQAATRRQAIASGHCRRYPPYL